MRAKPHGLRRFLTRWHRRLGVAAAVLVILLAVSGILLNHTETLQLDSRPVQSSMLRGLYSLPDTVAAVVSQVGQSTISGFDEQVYLETTAVDHCPGAFIGAIAAPVGVLAACEAGLLWFTVNGEFLDYMAAEQLGLAGVSGIGLLAAQQPVLLDLQQQAYRLNLDSLQLQQTAQAVSWASVEPASAEWAQILAQQYYRDAISWERILLDLHSGRLLAGLPGVLLMDAAAIILLLLAASGIYMWWRRFRKG